MFIKIEIGMSADKKSNFTLNFFVPMTVIDSTLVKDEQCMAAVGENEALLSGFR